VMAKMKGLRGSALDVFGYTEERRMERAMIGAFEADVDRMLAGLSKERLATAVKLAAVPQMIRGYGHVKDASVGPAKAEAARLWGEWEKTVPALETVEA
jgi:indolepyruvate ferredoxin oxidoreductase